MQMRLRHYWRSSDWVGRILALQLGGYLLLEALGLACALIAPLRWWEPASLLSFYPDAGLLARSPWRLVLYVFPHQNMLHLLANLALIYCLLPAALRLFGTRRLLMLYVGGALAGSLTYLVGYHLLGLWNMRILPWGLRGCSSAILACLVAYLCQPQAWRQLRLQASRWVLLLVVTLLAVAGANANLGGTLAHVGGILLGLGYGWSYRQGRDPLVAWERRRASDPTNALADTALRNKLRHSGYASLSPEERARLRQLPPPRP